MNAVSDNSFTRMLKLKGTQLPHPKAILVVSAHWLTRGTFVSAVAKPPTIHDFYGFPESLNAVEYPVAGSPLYAKATKDVLRDFNATLEPKRGLDHGAWSLLVHMYPQASIPVFQVSVDVDAKLERMVSIGRRLRDLRKRGILVIGSGNMVHNLSEIDWNENPPTPDWAEEFDAKASAFIERRDAKGLCDYQEWGEISKMAHPSNDHFLPLLYAMGTLRDEDKITFIHEGFQNGSISMRCVQFG
jgi:4,5-DOPA dioxygenase extradiol